jgi:hypothetical protein
MYNNSSQKSWSNTLPSTHGDEDKDIVSPLVDKY